MGKNSLGYCTCGCNRTYRSVDAYTRHRTKLARECKKRRAALERKASAEKQQSTTPSALISRDAHDRCLALAASMDQGCAILADQSLSPKDRAGKISNLGLENLIADLYQSVDRNPQK